jgi:hypothetical protein
VTGLAVEIWVINLSLEGISGCDSITSLVPRGIAGTIPAVEIWVITLSLEGISGCDSIASLVPEGVAGVRLFWLAAGICVTLVTKLTGIPIGSGDDEAIGGEFSLIVINSLLVINSLCSETGEFVVTGKDCGTRSLVVKGSAISLGISGVAGCEGNRVGGSIAKLVTPRLTAGVTTISGTDESIEVTGAAVESDADTGLGASCQTTPLKLCDNRLISKFGWAATTIGVVMLLLGTTTVFVCAIVPIESVVNPAPGSPMTSGA